MKIYSKSDITLIKIIVPISICIMLLMFLTTPIRDQRKFQRLEEELKEEKILRTTTHVCNGGFIFDTGCKAVIAFCYTKRDNCKLSEKIPCSEARSEEEKAICSKKQK